MADIAVNDQDWSKLSNEDQMKINEILKTSGLISDGDAAVGASQPSALKPAWHIPNPLCKLGCNAAEAAAIAACATLSGPAAAVCVVAAHTAADYCRSRC